MDGVVRKKSYMTEFLAQIAGLPKAVCDRAKAVSSTNDFDPVRRPPSPDSSVFLPCIWLSPCISMHLTTTRHRSIPSP